MSTTRTVFDVRVPLDTACQPSQLPRFQLLADCVRDVAFPKDHPYDLAGPEVEQLCNACPDYRSCGHGAPVEPPDGFLYRLAPLRNLLIFNGGDRGDFAGQLPEDVHTHLMAEPTHWRPLSMLIGGPVQSRFDISWWTSLDLSAATLPQAAALRVGVALDWLSEHSVVLRVPSTDPHLRAALRVPTIVDAFQQPIFAAERDDDSPASGVTIDLSRPEALQPGVPEYVVGPLAVDGVEFRPVRIDTTVSADAYGLPYRLVPDQPFPLWEQLAAFYSDRLGGLS